MSNDNSSDNEKKDNRLQDLKQKIAATQKAEEEKKKKQSSHDMSDMAIGLRAGWEFILSVLIGAAAGYGLDKWLETAPFFMIVLLLLGMGAGFVNVYRITNNIGYSIGYSPLHEKKKNDKQSLDD